MKIYKNGDKYYLVTKNPNIEKIITPYNPKLKDYISTFFYKVILTVPHELCLPNNPNHTCDPYGIILANSIKKYVPNSIIIHGSINRSIIDLNRDTSYNTPFRQKIRDQISLHQESQTIFLIDCHSFPPNSQSFVTSYSSNPQVVILYNIPMVEKANNLVRELRNNNIVATALLGGNNSIIKEYEDTDIINLLVEVNEGCSTDEIDRIGKSIFNWIHQEVS